MDSVTSGTNSTCGGDETRREIFGQGIKNLEDPESSSVFSGGPNLTTTNISNTYNKTIVTSPEELTFAGVIQGQLYLQTVTLKNTLSAPVELNLKSSSSERLEVDPQVLRLAPHETAKIDVALRQMRPFPAKVSKQKETIFIRSDFFDQKIPITILPDGKRAGNSRSPSTGRQTFKSGGTTLGSLQRATSGNRTGSMGRTGGGRTTGTGNFGEVLMRDMTNMTNLANAREVQNSMTGGDSLGRAPFSPPNQANLARQTGISSPNNELLRESLGDRQKSLITGDHQQNQSVRQLRDDLEKALLQNQELRTALTQQTAQKSKQESEQILNELKGLLRDHDPKLDEVVEVALRQERLMQEQKNLKVLDILKFKDRQLEELNLTIKGQGDLNLQLQVAAKRISDLENQLQTSKEESRLFEQKYSELLKGENNCMSNQNHLDQEETISHLKDKIADLEENLQNGGANQFLQEATQRAQSQNDLLKEKIQMLDEELAEERRLSTKYQDLSRSLREKIERLDTDQDRLFTQDEIIGSTLEILDKIAQNCTDFGLTESDSRLNKLVRSENGENALITKANQIMTLVGQLKSQNSLLEDQIKQIDAKQANKRSITTQSELNTGHLNDMEGHYRSLQEQLGQKEEDNDTLEGKIKVLRQEIAILSKNNQNTILESSFGRSSSENVGLNGNRMLVEQQQQQRENKRMNIKDNFSGNAQTNQSSSGQEILIQDKNGTNLSQMIHNGGIEFSDSQGQLLNASQATLNQKISEMKQREKQLLDQLSFLKEQMKFQTSHSETTLTPINDVSNANDRTQDHNQMRLAQLEQVIFQQREQILNLQEDCANLRHSLDEKDQQMRGKLELQELRNKNLSELNKKYAEESQQHNYTSTSFGGNKHRFASGHPITSDHLGTVTSPLSMEFNSTQVETERMRQQVQQADLVNLEMKHQLQEAKVQLKQTKEAKKALETRTLKAEQDFQRLKVDQSLINAGFNVGQDSKMALLVEELRNKVKNLEAELRASGGIDRSEIISGQKMVSYSATGGFANDGTSLFALKEEYCTKLEKLTEESIEERSALKNENISLKQKIQGMTQQLSHMEDKELRLFTQLDELKALKSAEDQVSTARVKDTEGVIQAKNRVIVDLENEVKQKEKVLNERQEQLSILLTAMEQQSSNPSNNTNQNTMGDPQQRLANLAAELCSLKAVEAQKERKFSEAVDQQRQQVLQMSELEHKLNETQGRSATLERKLTTMQSSNELLERQKQDLTHQVEELQRNQADFKYKHERLQFQLKTRQETIEQLKTQVRRCETHFREQIEKVRSEMISTGKKFLLEKSRHRSAGGVNGHSLAVSNGFGQSPDLNSVDQSFSNERPKSEITLKIAIQQLHLIVGDFLERVQDQTVEQNQDTQAQIINEMEKTLGVAQRTIQRLEGDLEKERVKNYSLSNDWDALALNEILIVRQERFSSQFNAAQRILNERELDAQENFRDQIEKLYGVIRDQESKCEELRRDNENQASNFDSMKAQCHKLCQEKEDLQQNLKCIKQEQLAEVESLERRAEMTVDERYKAREESIKTYFDSNIAKILIGSGDSSEKILQLSRELCASQLLVDKQRSLLSLSTSERNSLESTLRFYKGQLGEIETKMRGTTTKYQMELAREKAQLQSAKVFGERSKRDQLTLQKDNIQLRESLELKQREIANVQMRLEKGIFEKVESETRKELERNQDSLSETKIRQLEKQVQSLQERLMDVQGCHIQELEEIKVASEVELVEAKRELTQQVNSFEKRFKPGTAPGEILNQNHELREQLSRVTTDQEHLLADLDQLRQELAEGNQSAEFFRLEAESLRSALNELESDLINQPADMLQQAKQQQQQAARNQQQNLMTENKSLKSALKSGRSAMKSPRSASKSCQDFGANFSMKNFESSSNFVFNPPSIVQCLLNTKRKDIMLNEKLRQSHLTEMQLRQQITEMIADGPSAVNQEEIVQQLLSQNQNILAVLQSSHIFGSSLEIDESKKQVNTGADQTTYGGIEFDFDILAKCLILYVNHISHLEQKLGLKNSDQNSSQRQNQESSDPAQLLDQASLAEINDAQRIVIRSLTHRAESERIKHAPERAIDRKLWYLELLEEQISSAEQTSNKLQEFVKRLQIGVTGNLHSAAEIKASSMDLATYLKEVASEIKTLRNVSGLIKHDVLSLQNAKSHNTLKQKNSLQNSASNNPFIENENTNHMSSQRTLGVADLTSTNVNQTQAKMKDSTNGRHSTIDRILSENEQISNQLSLTSKIKQSLEGELVQSKLTHATELQNIIQKFSNVEQKSRRLEKELQQSKNELEEERRALDMVRGENQDLASRLEDFESNHFKMKEQQAASKGTQKHLAKLQSDMQEWRKNHDETLKNKQNLIEKLQKQKRTLSDEKDKMRAEIAMLRQTQKDIRDGSELERLQQENQSLNLKLSEQVKERQKEVEFWVKERGDMRDKISHLEQKAMNQISENTGYAAFGAKNNNKAGIDVVGEQNLQDQADQLDKLSRKLRNREFDLKKVKSELVEAQTVQSKLKLQILDEEGKVRDERQKANEVQDELNLANQRLKEVKVQKELLASGQASLVNAADKGQLAIARELDDLRSEFASLKVTKEQYEEKIVNKERQEEELVRQNENLNRQIESLKVHLERQGQDYEMRLSTVESKNQALLSDLKFMRGEQQQMQAKVQSSNEQDHVYEQEVSQAQEQIKALLKNKEDARAQMVQIEAKIREIIGEKDELQRQLVSNEAIYSERLSNLRERLTEIRSEGQQAKDLMDQTIQMISSKQAGEKKFVDQCVVLSQKESQLKQCRKEMAQAKLKVDSLKKKNQSLKKEIECAPITTQLQSLQNQNSKASRPSTVGGFSKNSSKTNEAQQQNILEQQNKLNDILAMLSEDGVRKLLERSRKDNDLVEQLADKDLEVAKVENWNLALQVQVDQAREELDQNKEKLAQIQRNLKETQSQNKKVANQSEKGLKEALRALTDEINVIKSEWQSPGHATQQDQKIKDLKAEVKTLQQDLQRKARLVGQVKLQKEMATEEQTVVQNELSKLKDENAKLMRQIKDSNKSTNITRDLRGQVEWLTNSEKRLKEELGQLNEKLRNSKNEQVRKDQAIRDYRDKIEQLQSNSVLSGEIKGEISRLKELNRKLRNDLDVKDNQIRALKSRNDSQKRDLETLGSQQQTLEQQESQVHTQLKNTKTANRKLEAQLFQTVSALKRVGIELAARSDKIQDSTNNSHKRTTPIQPYSHNNVDIGDNSSNNQLRVGDLDRNPRQENDANNSAAYYKDSVDILGVSMNELQDFIKPKDSEAHNQMESVDLQYTASKSSSHLRASSGVNLKVDQANVALVHTLEKLEDLDLNQVGTQDIEEVEERCVAYIQRFTE